MLCPANCQGCESGDPEIQGCLQLQINSINGKWIEALYGPLITINRILRDMNDEGIKPYIYIFQDAELLGEGVKQIEISISPRINKEN